MHSCYTQYIILVTRQFFRQSYTPSLMPKFLSNTSMPVYQEIEKALRGSKKRVKQHHCKGTPPADELYQSIDSDENPSGIEHRQVEFRLLKQPIRTFETVTLAKCKN
mmetsp:Transcript_23316/g.49238  ORF Transcript_23316/g.49238 Transcript_23316/m.49238 type:complete len:107 (-) Transcript_23316:956-1276(-)